MNIGVDIRALTAPYRTGVGELITELLNALFSLDKTNQYFLFYNSYKDVSECIPEWQQNNVHYISTRWPNKLLNFCLRFLKYPKLDKLIIRRVAHLVPIVHKIDIFFSPNPNYLALSNNSKHILFIHDLTMDLFPQMHTRRAKIWHYLINPKKQGARADLIFCPSANTKRDLEDYYKIAEIKIKVLYPGLPSVFVNFVKLNTEEKQKQQAEIKKKYELPDNYILFLGTIEPRKNIVSIIEGFEMAHERLPWPYTLILAGAPGWKNKSIFERANRSPYRDQIKFIGFVNDAEKPALYSAAALFIYPSFYEGFGFPVLEAMAVGTPVITSNRSSLGEVTGSAAYIINPNRSFEIAEGINLLLNNKSAREAQINYAGAQAKQFDWLKAAEQFIEIIKNLS